MKLSPFCQKVHNACVEWASKRWIVENVLIVKVEEENGEEYDCIYCTIFRNAVLFFFICLGLGYLFWG